MYEDMLQLEVGPNVTFGSNEWSDSAKEYQNIYSVQLIKYIIVVKWEVKIQFYFYKKVKM